MNKGKKKPYILKEYDTITYKDVYADEDDYCVVPKKCYDELESYISSFEGSNDEDDIRYFMQMTSRGIVARNYVGLIQLKSGCQFQIMPKISFKDKEGEEKTSAIFMEMIRSLKEYSSKSFNQASVQINKMNIFEIFICMYIENAESLVKHGLKSSYSLIEENSPYFKGKLLVSKHIKYNTVNKARFYVEHDEFLINRPENKLIKSSLLKLLNLTSNNDNERRIRQLLVSFEEVDESDNYEKDFSKVRIDRNTKDYELLMKWSKVILFDQNFMPFSGKSDALSLLYPMEIIFQDYVAEKMKKYFYPDGWEISTQNRVHSLFESPKMFKLIPDIVAKKDGHVIILDTKWKQLNELRGQNYGITSSDMYQMYIYSKKYATEFETPHVYLLYPYVEAADKIDNYTFKSDDGVCVELFFVDVANIYDSLNLLKDKMEALIEE